MKNIYLFFKYQKYQILILLIFVHIPYAVISRHLPAVPYMHYFFLIMLFLTKVLILNESHLKEKLRTRVQRDLSKENKKNPSRNEIFKRIQFILMAKNLTLLLAGTAVIIMAIYFQKF